MPVNKRVKIKKKMQRRKLYRTALKNLNQQKVISNRTYSLSDIDRKIFYYENLLKRM